MKKFFRDFKAFISRGNVMDLAVGMIIGTAFTAIVTALSEGILKPLINYVLALIFGEGAMTESFTFLKQVFDDTGAIDLANSIYIDWGGVINAVINFLLIALVLFVILKATMAAKGALSPKYYGYTKEEFRAMKKSGKTLAEIRSRREGARRGKSRSRQGRRGGSREAYHGSAARRHQEYSRRSGEKGLSFFVPFGKNIAESYARMNMRAFFLCR